MDRKIWSDSEEFKKFEKKAIFKSKEAIKIYETNFAINFYIKKDERFSNYYKRIIYITDDVYNIGYRSLLDKRGDKSVPLKFLAKINSETGEIIVVK